MQIFYIDARGGLWYNIFANFNKGVFMSEKVASTFGQNFKFGFQFSFGFLVGSIVFGLILSLLMMGLVLMFGGMPVYYM